MAMADIHELILRHGRNKAREMVPPESRRLVEIAAEMLAEEDHSIGVTYSGFCLTALPHKPTQLDETWVRQGGRVTLMVIPGQRLIEGKPSYVGVPYGARARMILFYLQSEALKRRTREVVLGRSMNDWLARMGMSVGGESFRAIREQSLRISRCMLSFDWEGGDSVGNGHIQFGIVDGTIEFDARSDPRQGALFEEVVHLSERFYNALAEHPVPVRDLALRELSGQSMALDCYCWLAYRLHSLSKPTPVSWAALFAQFGSGFSMQKHFKKPFIKALNAALAAYPEARVTENDNGFVLHPSRSPVPKLIA
ncbi:MAG TPA: replication protein RepA [Azospirillaceae bacterium]|nr:replication protein RepA [Azospirillaceae bacterium]